MVVRVAWLLLLPALVGAESTALERDVRALLKPQSLGGIALAFGAAGLAHGLDDEFSGHIDSELAAPLLDFGNFYFGSKYSVGSTAGLWFAARAAHRGEIRAASGEVLRALILAGAMNSSASLKRLIALKILNLRFLRISPAGVCGSAKMLG